MQHINIHKNYIRQIIPFALVGAGLFFVVYQIFRIESFWNDHDWVKLWMGRFLGQNLQGMEAWQFTAARVVDVMLWSLLFRGWLHGARAVWSWHNNQSLNEAVVEHLSDCSHLVCAAWGLTMLLRPARNLLVQWHLPLEQWTFRWQASSMDALTLVLCLCLLTMLMLARQWQQTDRENKGFI